LLKSIVPLPAAALLEPSPLLLPGLRLLPAALRLLLRLRENRTLLSRGLLRLLPTLLLLLLSTLLRLRLRLLLRRLLRALRLLLGLWCVLLRLLSTFLLFWLLHTLLRLRLRLLLRHLCTLRCLLSVLWLLLGLRCVLLPLRLLSVLLLCRLSALLRLPPLLLSLFLVVLRVSGYDQSGKQADCCGAGSTSEFHVMNSYRTLIQARRVPSGTAHFEPHDKHVVYAVHWSHHANELHSDKKALRETL
jgi:hypothetical protein